MFLAILFLLIGLVLFWDYATKKRRNDMLHYMPGPKALPLIGNVLMYRGQSPEQIMQFIANNRRKYGKLYRVWVLQQLAVFSCDPNDIEIILASPQHITKNNLYELLHSWLGNGLLMSTGKKWHKRRKILTPAFHFKILEQFVEIFNQQSTIMVKKMELLADGKTPVNIFPYVCLAALDIIAETAMGTKINAQMNSDVPYVKAVTNVTHILAKRFINIWQRMEWIFRLRCPGDAKIFDDSIKTMHDFTENIIMERRKALENDMAAGIYEPYAEFPQNAEDEAEAKLDSNVLALGQKRRMALLDVLLQSTIDGQPLSNDDIREEVDTFMFEGHDTTTSGIAFCLHLLSRHPDVQDKAFAEINEMLGDNRQNKEYPLSLQDLNNLKYLECVIKESLRLYPPVPIIGRYLTEDVEINGNMIPKNTNYTIGIYVLLRDPEYFPEPDSFKPERFLNEFTTTDGEKMHAYSYVPFSAGPRNCIGQKFAMLEMKSTISKVLRHFELLPLGPAVRPMMNLVLRSANGSHLGLRQRVHKPKVF